MTPLDEGSGCHNNLYLTTHNTHNRHPYPWRYSNPQSQQASGRGPCSNRDLLSTWSFITTKWKHQEEARKNSIMEELPYTEDTPVTLKHQILIKWRRTQGEHFPGTTGLITAIKDHVTGRVHLKCDNTRWRTGGEVKGKLANAVGSQYPSHYLGTWCIQHYYRWCAHLGCQ